MNRSPLYEIATGRPGSLFDEDMAIVEQHLRNAVSGKRILAIGGAGSIGSSTVLELAALRPDTLHIVDQNENGLAELVRQMRSRPQGWSARDFRALPLDYGSATMAHFIRSEKPYDIVLNFAALKHVRSEKDPYSTLQIFETNLAKQARLMRWLANTGFDGRFFTVSTDKAANPSSMMGATKRMMEHVMFNSSAAADLGGVRTSARFANVAFSNGSLLQAFEHRLARGEALAVPRDTKRYFVSLGESGQICSIAATFAPGQTIVIPKLDPEEHLVLLQEIAERFLHRNGFAPAYYDDEAAACANVEAEKQQGRWPLLITPLDTAGEKPYEEFVTKDEVVADIGLPNLQAVNYLAGDKAEIDAALAELDLFLSTDALNGDLDKDRLKAIIARVEPSFLETHRESSANLDQRL
jgi:Predicted nucleoside-diphosphate sugar epimerases